MEVVGAGNIHVWGQADELPHPPGPQSGWQESVVMVWWDLQQDIGGFYRIGHEVNNADDRQAVVWSFTFTPQGIFRKSSLLPLRDEDRTGGIFGSGDATHQFEFRGQAIWTLDDDDISAKLRVHDFHAGFDGYPKDTDIAKVAPAHMEVAGKIVGDLTVKGVSYRIDGLAFRDHGWGHRAWNTLLSHRWLVGTFGPEFSFLAVSFHSSADQIHKFGWIVKGETVIFAKHVDILTYLEIDAITGRGRRLKMEMNTGEMVDIGFEAMAPSAVFFHHHVTAAETLCRVTMDGRVGIADFETTNNAQHGSRQPRALYNGIIENGWHRALKQPLF
jgi:hypothetical protein